MSSRNISQEDTMSIADKNLVDELSSGDADMRKIGKVCAAIYLQVDVQGSQLREIREVTEEHTEKLDALQKGQDAQKVVNEKTLAQTTATNGRVNKLEEKSEKVVSCPGKCIPLAAEIEELKAIIPRVEALEIPVKKRTAVREFFTSTGGTFAAITAVICGILYIPGVGDAIFKKKEPAIEEVVARVVAEQLAKQVAQTPAPQPVTPNKKP